MKKLITLATVIVLSAIMSTAAFADSTARIPSALDSLSALVIGRPATLGPSETGQPNQSCETTPITPGKAATAPGSAFNPSGKAGTVYAGEQPQNSRNTASVSQYDVACFEQP